MHGTQRGWILACLLATAALAGCAASPDANTASAACSGDWTAYEDPGGSFAVCHPEAWVAREDVMGTDVALIPQDETGDGFASNLNVIHRELAESQSAAEILDAQIPQLERIITGFEIVEKQDTPVETGDGHLIVYDGQQGQYDLRWHQWVLVQERGLLFVTYVTEQAEDPVGEATLERFIEHARLANTEG